MVSKSMSMRDLPMSVSRFQSPCLAPQSHNSTSTVSLHQRSATRILYFGIFQYRSVDVFLLRDRVRTPFQGMLL
jgi:hypothetical protein